MRYINTAIADLWIFLSYNKNLDFSKQNEFVWHGKRQIRKSHESDSRKILIHTLAFKITKFNCHCHFHIYKHSHFWNGTSALYVRLFTYCLLQLVKFQSKLGWQSHIFWSSVFLASSYPSLFRIIKLSL